MFANHIQSGINFDKFDKIPVKALGESVPPAVGSFESSGLRQFLLDNVTKSGYTKPTPIQKYAIPIILGKRDLMGCAQTGSGKTAAFLLPILHTLLEENRDQQIGRPNCVIVAPTRELTIQIYNEARKFALHSYIKVCIAYGGTASRYQSDNIAKGCHILVATPGRLMDFVDKALITFEEIRFVVLDEADRMLDMVSYLINQLPCNFSNKFIFPPRDSCQPSKS
jgi:probable ATP-dependent RNA helicase DDX4